MPPITEDAICLRHREWSETSQVVTLFTRGSGIIRGLAKGSKRERAPYSGGFETLARGEVVLYPKRTGLAVLASWDVTDTARAFRTSYLAQMLALYAVDLVAHLILDEDPHPLSFQALMRCLGSIRDAGVPEAAIVAVARFQRDLLIDTGVMPPWQYFEAPDGSRVAWIAADTGEVSHTPRAPGEGYWGVRIATLALINSLESESLDGLNGPTAARAVALLNQWVTRVIGRSPPSFGVLSSRLGVATTDPGRAEVTDDSIR
ncbi:MAG: DNA repair protein RecO [Planctomycetota bacterium]